MTDRGAREVALAGWARQMLGRLYGDAGSDLALYPASDDASFRRYFRGRTAMGSFIFVDAPPAQEDSEPFVRIAGLLGDAGLNPPLVLASDLELGFMMQTDLGDTQLQDLLNRETPGQVQAVYEAAVATIHRMQSIEAELPAYDEALLRQEMGLFNEWFLQRQLGIRTSPVEDALIESVFARLVTSALEQPVVFVHRDFHCRNIMIQPDRSLGIIDFQDAVNGPVTYDLVSLLRDCYHRFAPREVARLLALFREGLVQGGHIPDVAEDRFQRWFDWMGMQRHLKCVGIFSRLNLRDGKPRYLADIPLVFSYLSEVSHFYPELAHFGDWLDERVAPALARL